MHTLKTKELVYLAIMTAVIVALSLLIIIPIPATHGFVTIVDGGIYFVGMLFGPTGGLLVGGLSGLLIDILSGSANWALFSLIIHGLQGYVFAKLMQASHKWLGYLLAAFVMLGGYALATGLMFGSVAGLASLPSNLMQVIFATILAELLHHYLLTKIHL